MCLKTVKIPKYKGYENRRNKESTFKSKQVSRIILSV